MRRCSAASASVMGRFRCPAYGSGPTGHAPDALAPDAFAFSRLCSMSCCTHTRANACPPIAPQLLPRPMNDLPCLAQSRRRQLGQRRTEQACAHARHKCRSSPANGRGSLAGRLPPHSRPGGRLANASWRVRVSAVVRPRLSPAAASASQTGAGAGQAAAGSGIANAPVTRTPHDSPTYGSNNQERLRRWPAFRPRAKSRR